MTQLLTTREAAEFLNLHPGTFAVYVSTGIGPKVSVRGKRGKPNLFHPLDLRLWAETRPSKMREKQDVRLDIWVTPTDLNRWRAEASRRGIPLAQLIRTALNEQLP